MSRITAVSQAFIDFLPAIAVMVVLGLCLLAQRALRNRYVP
jgi:hypothetical protein